MEIELKQTQFIRLSLLEPNDGQVEGLPKNPRKISADDLERLKNSITKHPDFLALRELVVYPHGGKYVVLGGNMRLRALRQLKFKEAPCKVVPEGTAVEDLKTFAALDNGSFGSWDYDALANEWDDLPLVDLGIPAWEPEQDLPEPSSTSRAAGEDDVDLGEHVYAIRIVCRDSADQLNLFSEMEERGYEAQIV